MRKRTYPSKKAKRKAEYLERKKRREQQTKDMEKLKHAHSIEEMAAALGVKLE